jgi:hypothetical protein
MYMSKKNTLIVILMTAALTFPVIAVVNRHTIIDADNPNIQYQGRVSFSNPTAPALYWPGNYITARFQGTSVSVMLKDTGNNYYNVFIDGQDDKPIVIKCTSDKEIYDVAKNLEDKAHDIVIFRRTETGEGPTQFLGFVLDSGKKLLAPAPMPERKIEFYGDSITSGMGNEDQSRIDNANSALKNNYLAYGAMTARNLNAQYRSISFSGIGIMVSWYPKIMPDVYNRLNPEDPNSKWDFSKWTPDVVVINLFQNDSWRLSTLNPMPNEQQIIQAYIDFVQSIRAEYKDAAIFCILGNMDITKQDNPWPGYVKQAVEEMNNKYNDKKIYTFFEPFKETAGHPTVSEQRTMATHLTAFIKEKMNW